MNIQDFVGYIGKVHWKEAKTYRHTAPHEYTIRNWRKDLESEFEQAVKYIRENGTPEKFYKRTHIYLYVGAHKYWTMGDPVNETVVLNRCLIKDYYPGTNIYKKRKRRW